MYKNSFDNYAEWGFNNNTLYWGNSHSGGWCVEMDGNRKYGPGFSYKIKNLGLKDPQKIKVSVWVFLPNSDSNGEVIVSVGEEGRDAVMWEPLRTKDLVKAENKWVQMAGEFEFPENTNPEYNLNIILMSTSNEKIYIDDVDFDLE